MAKKVARRRINATTSSFSFLLVPVSWNPLIDHIAHSIALVSRRLSSSSREVVVELWRFNMATSPRINGSKSPLMNGAKMAAYNSTTTGATPLSFEQQDVKSVVSQESMSSQMHKTTAWETFIHLLKGYMGAGCLSLPWAFSQLGMTGGFIATMAMAYWSSYNCWTVVKLKRFIERSRPADETGSVASSVTTNTNITYPDVGEWAYGVKFQSYVTACVCVQQLAICTVFISFIGENLLAVFIRVGFTFLSTHFRVMTLALVGVMSLSFIPSLKTLAPVMAAGTILLLMTFVELGIIVNQEWSNRPDTTPTVNPPQVPLALCAILYSYEGICLILPVESAMKDPREFKKVFSWAMAIVALILATFACVCVLTFGNVTSGSVTAFLLESYRNDPGITWWLMAANTTVSLSVLLTYPLQLFPALELIAPWYLKMRNKGSDLKEEVDLAGFEPLPPLPEHDVASLDSLPSEHHYGLELDMEEDGNEVMSMTAMSSVASMFPVMTMPGDSPQLRASLVLLTFMVAVVVPNVQALISLAGALAGSSTALLIPPILELAWIRNLERDAPEDSDDDEARSWIVAPTTSRWGKWWLEKLKCYFLLFMGSIFCAIGTYASLADIVRIYRGKE